MKNRIAAAVAAVALVVGVLIGAAGTVLVGGTASRSPLDHPMMGSSMMGGSMMGGSMMGSSMMGGVEDMWQVHRQHHGGAR